MGFEERQKFSNKINQGSNEPPHHWWYSRPQITISQICREKVLIQDTRARPGDFSGPSQLQVSALIVTSTGGSAALCWITLCK